MNTQNTQKGYMAIVVAILIALALGIGGTYYVMDKKGEPDHTNHTTSTPPQKVGTKTYSDENGSFEYPADFSINVPPFAVTKGAEASITVFKGNLKFIVSNIATDSIGWETYQTDYIGGFVAEYKKNTGKNREVMLVARRDGTLYYLRAFAPTEEVDSAEFKASLNTILLTLK